MEKRFLFFVLLICGIVLHGQDTCDCRNLVQRNGVGMWGQYSLTTTTSPFTGICFAGSRDMKAEWKRYENGYLTESREAVYNGIAHYTYKEIRKDSLISIAESYNQTSGKLENKTVIYEKKGQRYRMTYTYTTDGKLMEVQRERYLRKGEGEAAGAPDHVFNKDGYYYNPVEDGIYLFYGGRHGIQNSKTPLIAGQYADGYKTGYWYEKYDTGTLKSTGWHKRDDKDSVWTYYHFNGNIESTGRYSNNGKDGEWRYWDYEGHLIEVSHFVMPFQEGSSVKYYPDGKLKSQEEYLHGRLYGRCREWYPDGKPQSDFTYDLNGRTGDGKTWYPNGQLKTAAFYQNNFPVDLYQEWYEDGKLKESKNYKRKMHNDTSRTWYANGNSMSFAVYADGKLNGKLITWYENGNKEKEEVYQSGKKNGTCLYWDTSGVLMKQIDFKNNTWNGLYKTWNKSGTLISEYNYAMQVRHGRCRRWDEKGNLIFDREYENGLAKNYQPAKKINTVANCKPVPERPFAACKNVQDTYEHDAIWIAYQSAMNPASPYYDSVIVPENLIDENHLMLINIYNGMSQSCPELYSIHEYYAANIQGLYNITIMFSNMPVPEWAANWKKGITKTGNDTIDRLIAANGISISLNQDQQHASYGYFSFTSSQPVNFAALDRKLKSIDPRITCYSNMRMSGDGDHIRFEKKENYTIAVYSRGYGDCPSGCIGQQVFRFYVYADGEADLIESGGTFTGYPQRMFQD